MDIGCRDHVIFPRTATGSYPDGRFPHPPDKAYLALDLVTGKVRPALETA